MSFESPLQTRRAAKLLLFTRMGEIVTVTGRSKRINLPGGGIDDGETSGGALMRELHEEIGIQIGHIKDLEAFGNVSGEVTSNGNSLIADWDVYGAELVIPVPELRPANDLRCQTFDRSSLLTNPAVSNLAQQAIIRFT